MANQASQLAGRRRAHHETFVCGVLFVLPNAAFAKAPVLDLGDICHAMMIQIRHGQMNGFSHYTCQTGYFVGVIAKMRVVFAAGFLSLGQGGAWCMSCTTRQRDSR
jgi:hypothetical protein